MVLCGYLECKQLESSPCKRFTIPNKWRSHSIFAISRQEETAFEEKFKYLIVTCPLLNNVLSFNNSHSELTFQTSRKPKLGITMVATLAILLGSIRPKKIPIITLFFSASASLFFLYRHKRRSTVRQLHQIALSQLQAFIAASDTFDTKIHEAIERSNKSPCTHRRVSTVLKGAFMLYDKTISQLTIHKRNLSSLYDMYNVHSIPSLEHTDNSLDQLAQMMHLKRRECMVHFLALDVMTKHHDSIRVGYEQGWKSVNDILNYLTICTEEMVAALDNTSLNPKLNTLIHNLTSLEQQLRMIELKLYSCNRRVRQMNNTDTKDRDKLCAEYLQIQSGFETMMTELKSGQLLLDSLSEPVLHC